VVILCGECLILTGAKMGPPFHIKISKNVQKRIFLKKVSLALSPIKERAHAIHIREKPDWLKFSQGRFSHRFFS
jgi:hypothetical protein